MQSFAYKAATPNGKVVEGTRDAPTRAALIDDLRQGGLIPIRIAEPGARGPLAGIQIKRPRNALTAAELSFLMKEIAAMLGAGIPAERAIAIAAKSAARPRFKAALGRLHELLRGGAPFAAAVRDALPGLPVSAASLIEAGEATARLPEAIADVGRMLSESLAFRRALSGALIYPAILLATSIGAILFLLTFVLPQFQAAFAEAGAKLPVSTEILLAIGHAIAAWGPYALALLLLAGGALLRWRASPAGRQETDRLLLAIPLARGILTQLEIARFARGVGSLLAARVTLVRALRLAESGAGNLVLGARIKAAGERVKRGERLAAALSAHGPWPADALELIHIGEEAGRLDAMLLHLADLYEGALKRKTERALTLLTPALTLTMAGIVAAIIGSVLSAILGAYDLPM